MSRFELQMAAWVGSAVLAATSAPAAVATFVTEPSYAGEKIQPWNTGPDMAPAELLLTQVLPPPPPPRSTMNQAGVVIGLGPGGALSLRMGPGTGFGRVATIPEGSSITVLAQVGNWFWVRMSNGMMGYASGQYIQFAPSAPGSLPAVPKP